MDNLNAQQRQRCMGAIRSKDTTPELRVRSLVHRLGYRYRLHVRTLPGAPDLVFPRRRKVIFVHGCFWHRHCCKRGQPVPKTRSEYWLPKLEGNRARDLQHRHRLRKLGWDVLVVWECQALPKRIDWLGRRIAAFLESGRYAKMRSSQRIENRGAEVNLLTLDEC